MGGPGSGRHYWSSKKTTVEECLSIDANHWIRQGILRAGVIQSGSLRWSSPGGGGFSVSYRSDTQTGSEVWLSYSWVWRFTGESGSTEYPVRLTTPLPFGKPRWWFTCPLVTNGVACGRRVVKLYLPPRGRYFGCRVCHGLTYRSCQESHKYDRLYRLGSF